MLLQTKPSTVVHDQWLNTLEFIVDTF